MNEEVDKGKISWNCNDWHTLALMLFAEKCNRCTVKVDNDYRTCEICPARVTVTKMSWLELGRIYK